MITTSARERCTSSTVLAVEPLHRRQQLPRRDLAGQEHLGSSLATLVRRGVDVGDEPGDAQRERLAERGHVPVRDRVDQTRGSEDIDGMVADNLVHRKADPRDRRRVLVHITRRGLALQRRLSERIVAESDAIFGDVDDHQVAGLLESLAAFIARLR
jgi:hypothetical protein